MAMVCPQCNEVYEQQLECPTCAVRLLYDANPRRDEGQWQQTPWGRILVGLLLAQGLAHGLRLVARAGLQVSDGLTDRALWSSPAGILLLQGLQGFGLLVGGTICGAGQQRGILYGSFVGMVNGLIFLFIQLGHGNELNEVAMYGQPVLHLALGAAGGLLGALIWRPLPTVRFQPLADVANKVQPVAPLGFWSGPIYWSRVLAGVVLVVSGVVWAKSILGFVIEASEGKLEISTHLQGRLVMWEICAIAALVGAGVAGATTANGAKQGILAGIFAVIVIMGLYLGNPQSTLEITTYFLCTLLLLTLVGGWFGSQLFPPIAPNSRSRRTIRTV
jgi:hypothetical protein